MKKNISINIHSIRFIFIWMFCFAITSGYEIKAQTCTSPTNLIFGSTLLNQTTCGTGNDFSQNDACGNTFLNGEDYVYSYTPTLAGVNDCITIDIVGLAGNNNRGVFVFDDCPDISGTNCVAQAVTTPGLQVPLSINDLQLNVGATYLIVVSSLTGCHSFNILLQSANCSPTQRGDNCSASNVISSLPFSMGNLTTCGAGNDYNSGNILCNPNWMNGEDYIFQYTPANNECISILLNNTNIYTGLYVLNACPSDPNKTCIASAASGGGGNPSIPYVALGAGKTYYIIVSSYDLYTSCTDFDIAINNVLCCGVGSTCYSPDVITALPFLQSGLTTCGSCNDYDNTMGCGGLLELFNEDYVFSYTPSSDECVTISLTGTDANVNESITLFDGCPEDISTNCLATGSAALAAFLIGGQTYFIVVSSRSRAGCTPFNIGIINALPPGLHLGENCANPFVIPALPFTQDSMTSACFGNDYSPNTATSCGGGTTNGEDFVFAYTSPGGESVNIVLSNTSLNIGLYVLDGCPDDPNSSCVAYQQPRLFDRNPALCGVALTDPGTYYIVIDQPLGFTDFNISIQQSPSPGQDCINSYPINSLPFNLTGQTTRCYVNDYDPNADNVCDGNFFNRTYGEDFILTYPSPGGESINIRLSNTDINTGLFILDRCPNAIGVTCLGSSSGTNPSLCSVPITTPGIYYIIVDKNWGFTSFNIDIELDQDNDPGTDCINPYSITDLPFLETGFTTACYGNDYDSTHACGSSYMNGEDFVFEFTTTSTKCLQITANNLSASGGLYVLNNCPDVPGATCIAQDTCNFAEGCNSLVLNSSFSPGTYYIVVSSSSSAANLNFDLSIDTAASYDATIVPVGTICLLERYTLSAVTPGGAWSGPGIANANNGLFDGALAGAGTHTIRYAVGSNYCLVSDSIQIEVQSDCDCVQNLLQNPSFEGNPQSFVIPSSWTTCWSTPDILPGKNDINLPPSHGSSYLGMCDCFGTREWISSEQLRSDLITGIPYSFTIDLAKVGLKNTPVFISGTCIGLQIWGGFSSCNPEELLWKSGSVDNITWETYNVSFIPSGNYDYIMLIPVNLDCTGCRDITPSTGATAGISTCGGTCPYLLMDNISPVIPEYYPGINIDSISSSPDEPCTFDITGTTTNSIPTSITLFGDFIGSPLNIPVTGLNWQTNLSYPSSLRGASTIIAMATFSSGCTDSDSITIDVIDMVPAFFASGLCYGETTFFNDTSTISMGNIDSWSWNFGDGTVTSNQQNTFYTYAAPGTYNVTLTVTTDAGCLDSVTRTIAIYDVIASAGSDDTICQGNNYALAGIIAGDAHYIVWETMSSGVFDNDSLLNPIYTPSANDILAGSVELIITAFDSTFTCSTSDTMTLIIPKELFLTSSATNPPCGQSDGEICIVADRGIAPYNYQWNDANNQTDSCASNLPAGIYQVTVTDANNNCTTIATITLSNLNGPLVEIDSVAHVTCNGGSDGSGIIAVSGGDAPYIFTWTPAVSTNDTALNLSAGDYICGVTDFMGCIQFVTLTITQPDSISATTSSTPPTSCGTNTGSATVIPGGGTSPYTYLWSAEAGGQITATANNLNPGVYSCTVSDINGCTQTFSVTVNDLNGPVVTLVSQTPVSCKGGDNGSAVISATGGLAPYTYSWSPQGGTSNTAANLSSGTYTVTVRDANNCTGSLAVTITELDSLFSEVSSNVTICPGISITLNAIAQGGTPPYSYNWNPGAIGGSSVTVSPAVSTTYTVAVTDANNCTAAPQSVNVDIYALPVMSFSADPKEGCAPLCVSFSNTTPNVNIVNWEFGDGQVASGVGVSHCYSQAGNYSPTLTVTDNNGCTNSLTAPDLIKVFPNPVADFTTTPPNSSPVSSAILFNNLSIGASHWLWNFGDFHNSSSKQKNPIFTYHEPGSYLVNLSVASNMGCTDTVSHTLIIEPEYTLYIPNAFSPDDDRVNDFFAPKGAEFISFEMNIYNRWGERIYHTTDIDKPWDGKLQNKNEIAQEGVYVYKIWVKDFKNEIHYYVGNVTLLK